MTLHVSAQDPWSPLSPEETLRGLRQLARQVTVLYVVAHPDDEDPGFLTWLARKEGARVVLLSLTRGEGGANLIGSEAFDRLGLLRASETRAAAARYGAEVMFTPMVDFGYSKRPEECFEVWGHKPALREVVRVIRLIRPDIVISRFQGNARDGHGAHQAAGILSREAFEAAGDASRFTELSAEGLGPWQPAKFYTHVEHDQASTHKIPFNDIDPLLGLSYADLGVLGYSSHRTQGASRITPARFYEPAQLLRLSQKTPNESSLWDGINTPPWSQDAARIAHLYNPLTPLPTAIALLNLKAKHNLEQLDALIGQTLGVNVSAHVTHVTSPKGTTVALEDFETPPPVTPGSTLRIKVDLQTGLSTQTQLHSLRIEGPEEWRISEIKPNNQSHPSTVLFEVKIPEQTGYSRPNVSRRDQHHDSWYTPTPNPHLLMRAVAELTHGSQSFVIKREVTHLVMNAMRGPEHYPVQITPGLSLTLSPLKRLVPTSSSDTLSSIITAQVTCLSLDSVHATLTLQAPTPWVASPSSYAIHCEHPHDVHEVEFVVHLKTKSVPHDGSVVFLLKAKTDQHVYSEHVVPVGYPGIEQHLYFEPSSAQLTLADLTIKPLHVGYVLGTGDHVAKAMSDIGMHVTMLDDQALAAADLKHFDAIVIGIRAYEVRRALHAYRLRLLDFVKAGGTLLVQAQTQGSLRPEHAPYPFAYESIPEEVSEENAPVTLLHPTHVTFQNPHGISEHDFAGWVEQRGSLFWESWYKHYTPLIATHDQGQPAQHGALLVTDYGKGRWVYAALAFYRQLPAGVPGAYRLFLNLLHHSDDR